jgi:heme oxygenase|tara:strand:- start:1483 stop:2058 length:576 start_codon:yes stop_codon:yes gene_type:complete
MKTEYIMSNKLKELTWAHHQSAERRLFAKELISGNIEPKLYHKFLCCQYLAYKVLERVTIIPPNLIAIHRAPRIFQDIRELEELFGFEPPGEYPESVDKYIAHVDALSASDNNEALLANMYVRHFGELHGGQIIKKKTPGSGLMYEFNGDTKVLIEEFRTLLSDDMADEAKKCFDFASELFDELSKEIIQQ